ncbi:amino acid adenylation domain-containing protein [Saccharopolyspora erythraea NRRL 2338]|uniref:Non-ribosomal peptide synthetase/polyketide synthase n=2 Tax=Saccharopolyspora erythraea TaxID=1836 RepID=A4FHM3_SACEN|nr:amino acid adenylation domain-containing protein [Saccharopolyspora erythraea]PFG97238.1 amino acid adenylation domain-containing protein [Saccharopolyspora erythraea NRRL 2338]QRK87432.1 amino acid adenylation domain-containing protein [Saccharopolyspora erythraea]CAM03548.1 non-ribosomal peptide synthetase/polyketide synthase [Saccharopolyspora erythraea NRRL 2338]
MNQSTAGGRGFWAEVLESAAFTPIPRWYEPTVGPDPRTEVHERTLPDATVEALRAASDALGVRPGTVLLAAHVKVLAEVTGERHVVTGYWTGEGDPMPCSLALPDGSWREVVEHVGRAETALREHLPGSLSELGHTGPLFDTVFDLAGSAAGTDHAALHVSCTGDALRLSYRVELLSPEQVDRLGGYYLAALRLIGSDLDAAHTDGSLLSDAEVEFQLTGLAGPERALPDLRVHELFEQRVDRHPDAVAAVHQGQEWTYRRLDERANQIANALLGRGLRREDVVAVVTDRNLDWMASVLGVFKAGGCYLPVEPDFPADRIARTLRRSECRFALAESGRTANLDQAGAEAEVLPLRDIDGDTTRPGVPVDADQLAYVYFTSGSTGEPKGAMCEHAGMTNHLYAKIDDLGIGEGAVVSETAPQCFDISLWQLVSALLVGGRTLIVEQDVILDVQRFVDTIAEHGVQIAQLVPSYLETVLSCLEDAPRPLPALQCVSVTGEALKKELTQRWFATYPEVRLANAYGLTETSDDTNHEVMSEVPVRERVPLGPAVNNTRVYIVDERLRPVPLGAPGEIVFSGVCVGRGYINDEERTRAAFLPDPHRPGQRLYRSGDFGRWLPEGKVEFLGRRDAQVKIRGFRIEIGEIENQLLRAPGVRDGAVVVTEDAGGNKHLVAFHTGQEDIAADEFKGFLRRSLPHYMVPEHFHHCEALPLTGNGKTDKKALSALAAERAAAAGEHQPPRTPTERMLAGKWAEVLGVPVSEIGRDDHFFDRGGTSLSAVRLIIKLDRQVSLKDVNGRPVLADLAAVIDGRTGAGGGILQRLSTGDGSGHGLVVFPYAGGGPVNFHSFAQALQSRGIAVHAVELPGHDLGADAGSFAELEQIVKEVVAEIGGLGLRTVSLWGHSAGAAFAAYAARLLEEQGTAVHQVIVAARAMDTVEELQADIAEAGSLSLERIKQRLSAQEAFRELAQLRTEHADNVAQAYRHDVRSAAQYLVDVQVNPPQPRLSAPLTVVFAEGDPGKAEGLARHHRWEAVARHVDHRQISGGGHYFLATHAAEAAAVVRGAAESPTA